GGCSRQGDDRRVRPGHSTGGVDQREPGPAGYDDRVNRLNGHGQTNQFSNSMPGDGEDIPHSLGCQSLHAEALEYLVDLRVSIFCRGDAMARDMRESRSVRCSNDSLRRTADLRVERFRSAAQLREPFLGLYLG